MRDRVRTRTIAAYKQSCLDICAQRLKSYGNMAEIGAAEDLINVYPDLGRLEEPRGVVILDPAELSQAQLARAKECVLEGRLLAEHAAAGEATRLKLGTKYLINPQKHLTTEMCLADLAAEEGREVGLTEFLERSNGVRPEELPDLSLGARHMLQMAFDLGRLAGQEGRNPETVRQSQWMVVILNESSAGEILKDFSQSNFFGFLAEQVLFMVQFAFEGISLAGGRFAFDPRAKKRLHNHGQMAMQQTAEEQIFHLAPGKGLERFFLSPEEMAGVLGRMEDKLSYNIEDLAYLTGALDLEALALALALGDEGQRMVMEIVANNPLKPQKGGLAAWDAGLERNVMIESFQLLGVKNEEITHLNRNFNHYPKPQAAFEALASGLPMPIAVKEGTLYFQPVQGDLNFLLPTAFVQRKVLGPISNWKSAATTPPALAAMADQDRQPSFIDFAQETLARNI